jgi:hypothetical protein
MPEVQWMLTPQQVEDLVAYIVSLDMPVSLPGQWRIKVLRPVWLCESSLSEA